MRLAKLITLVPTLGLIACGLPDPDPIQVQENTPEETVVDTTKNEIVRRSGIVTWHLDSTDCPREREEAIWGEKQYAEMELNGDSLLVQFEIMPELRGTVRDGSADLSGTTVFQLGDEDVTCTVVGVTKLGQSSMTGDVSETLTSQSALNCTSSGSFEVDFDI